MLVPDGGTIGCIMVTTREAKRIAQDQVEEEASEINNFYGAFLSGS